MPQTRTPKAQLDATLVDTTTVITAANRKARKMFYVVEDFLNLTNTSEFLYNGTGTGGMAVVPDLTTIGLATFNTGTTTTGRYGVWSNNASSLFFGSTVEWMVESKLKVSALSDGTDTYQIFSGFLDSITGEATDGAYFSYTSGLNGGRFECVTANNATRTRTDSGVSVVADTFYNLRVIVRDVAGTLTAQYYINDTLVASNTTNIPITAARATGYGTLIVKSAGTTSRFISIDYTEVSGYYLGANR